MKRVPIVVALLALLLAGCSMRQRLVINPNGSGSADIHIVVGPLLATYIDDIMQSLGPTAGGGSPPLFDLAKIRTAVEGMPGVKLESLSSPSRGSLALRFRFDHVNALVPAAEKAVGGSGAGGGTSGGKGTGSVSGGGSSPIELTEHDGVHTLRLVLSRSSLKAVEALPPFRGDPLLLSLGPQPGQHYTKAEYLSNLQYAFAGYASKEQVRKALAGASVDITLKVKGTIVSHSGGVRSGDEVSYHIPLIEIATLEHPIELSVSFR